MIDIHCHLTFEQFDEERERVIEEAKEELKAVIISGVDPEDSKKTLKLSEDYPKFIYTTLGLHPVNVDRMKEKEIETYLEFIKTNRRNIVGIGEIGLDYHWVKDVSKIRRMKEVFIEFLELSKELNLPVVLHLRNGVEEGLRIIEGEDIKKAVFHCYSGGMKLAREIWEEKYYISLASSIRRSKNMKKVARSIPLSLLLTETDAPFLSPVEGEINVPKNVRVVYEEVSKLRGMEIKELCEKIVENSSRLFDIPNFF
ncbi:MAG: putative DNAse [Candidatus Methanolliviera sp. GoM_asphalt]|nr:MAG: putative DNAse [Candidatus Methanolliviera sp. GoM_asphalt]